MANHPSFMQPDTRVPPSDGDADARVPWRMLSALMALNALLVLPFLGFTTVDNNDEGHIAAVAKEMAVTGDWWVPRIGGVPYASYPPLGYWCIATSGCVFGWSEWAVRLPGALAGVALVGLAGALAWRLTGSRTAAALSAVALATTPAFASQQPVCRADVLLMLFVTAAVCLFLDIARADGGLLRLVGFYVCLGLAVLAKGPLGLVLPGLAIGGWVLITRRWHVLVKMHPWFGLPLVAAMTAPWYWHFARVAGSDALAYNLLFENVENFTKGGQHPQPVYYYLRVLPRALPWLLSLAAFRRLPAAHRGSLLPAVWFLTTLAFLSAASAKRINYITYLCPPLAVLEGMALAAAVDAPRARRVLAASAASLAAIGVAFVASLLIFPSVWTARVVLERRDALALAGAVAAAVFALAAVLAVRGLARAAVGASAAVLAGGLVLYAATLDPSTDDAGRRDAAFCRSFADRVPSGARIGTWGDVPKGHFYFYSPRPLIHVAFVERFSSSGIPYGLSFESKRPARSRILAQCPVEGGLVWTLWEMP